LETIVMNPKVVKMDEEWMKELSAEAYEVLRKKGTERPFSGDLLHNKEDGTYRCAGCGNVVFLSKDKFDSGTGWPSFTDAVAGSVELVPDHSHGMTRIEVRCSRCGGHLGHVFSDGPKPTGKRYCINCAGLSFQKSK
jgi:peptide-methionine (R)-S-oxide reductase